MLNEEELTPEQKRIIQLENQIKKFKLYDAKRKAYYAKILIEHGQMQSYIDELESGVSEQSLLNKIRSQRNTIMGLQRIIKINEYQDSFEDLDKKTLQLTIKELEGKNKDLKNKNEKLQKHNNDLVKENLQLINKTKALTEKK